MDYKFIFSIIMFFIGGLLLVSELKNKLPFGISYVESDSMSPNLSKGDLVFWKQKANYQNGGIILFKNPLDEKDFVAHRIESAVYDNKIYYETKGDANADRDPWQVREDRVLGEVFFNIPYFGGLVKNLSNPVVVVSVVLIPSLLLIVEQGLFLYKESNLKITSLIKNK